jgi:hypothetical protein
MADFIFTFLPVFAFSIIVLTWIVFSLYPRKPDINCNGKFIFIILLTALISTVLTVFLNAKPWESSDVAAKYGQMGDFFGGMLNPILAFASFIALLYTVRIQFNQIESVRAASADNTALTFIIESNKAMKELGMSTYKLFRAKFKSPHDGEVCLNDVIFRILPDRLNKLSDLDELDDLKSRSLAFYGRTSEVLEIKTQLVGVTHAAMNEIYSQNKILQKSKAISDFCNDSYIELYQSIVRSYSACIILNQQLNFNGYSEAKRNYFEGIEREAIEQIRKQYFKKLDAPNK